jgi:hypothetical protein
VNIITFFGLNYGFKRCLSSLLHPFPLCEELMSLFFYRRVLQYDRIFHQTVSTHRGKCDTVLVHIDADNRIRVVLIGDVVILVRYSNMKSPLVVFVDYFSRTNMPFIIVESSPKSFKMVWTATPETVKYVSYLS